MMGTSREDGHLAIFANELCYAMGSDRALRSVADNGYVPARITSVAPMTAVPILLITVMDFSVLL